MKKTLSVFLALLMVLLSMVAYADENPTVVTVNGDSITQAELDAMMSALDARMTQYGIDTSSENVQNAIREAAHAGIGGRPPFDPGHDCPGLL